MNKFSDENNNNVSELDTNTQNPSPQDPDDSGMNHSSLDETDESATIEDAGDFEEMADEIVAEDSVSNEERQKRVTEIKKSLPAGTDRFFVVGIGASAGGLKALESFFDHLPSDSGAAFVVIQHLSPNFKTLMPELLGRRTSMKVQQATNGMLLRRNCVYLIPPRHNITLRNRRLVVKEQLDDVSHHPNFPINIFFHSLASEYGERAIAIILSGTGSDGTEGLEALSDNGGIALVQSPSTAEFDGMPQTAIATGLVDHNFAPGSTGPAHLQPGHLPRSRTFPPPVFPHPQKTRENYHHSPETGGH